MDKHRRVTRESVEELRQLSAKIIDSKLQILLAVSLPQVHQVIRAFHDRKPLRGSTHETNGKEYFLFKHKIAEHSKHGLKVSNAGYDTPTTYNTLKKIGVGVDVKNGITHIDNQAYPEKEHGNFLTVPYSHVKDLQPHEIRSIDNKSRIDRGNFTGNEDVNKLREFSRDVKQHMPSREMIKNKSEHGINKPNEIGLSETAIQPEHQRTINKITGIKSKIPKETLGTKAHHILYKERFPGLAFNKNNGIALSNKEHNELHRLNPHSIQGGKLEELKIGILEYKLQKLAELDDDDNTTYQKSKHLKILSKKNSEKSLEQRLSLLQRLAENKLVHPQDRHKDNPELPTFGEAQRTFNQEKHEGTINYKRGFSYLPHERRVYDATKKEDALEMHKKFGNGKDPLHVIMWTDNPSEYLSKETESKYNEIVKEGRHPIIGGYTEGGHNYTDVGTAQSMTDEKAREELKKHGQRSSGRIDLDGKLSYFS